MSDVRPQHIHRPSHAASLYGAHGPMQDLGFFSPRPMTTKLQWPAGQPVTPETIAQHLDQAIAKVPTLSAKQRAAIHAVLSEKVRDLHFAKLVASQLHPMHDHSEGTLP
jgi:hypothetical protein